MGVSSLLHLDVVTTGRLLGLRHGGRGGSSSLLTSSRSLGLGGSLLLRAVLGLATAPAPRAEEAVNVVVLPDAEVAATGGARGRLLNLGGRGADDGNRGVERCEVLVLLQGVGEGRETVVDEGGQVGWDSVSFTDLVQ
jgi:hypothetical protein